MLGNMNKLLILGFLIIMSNIGLAQNQQQVGFINYVHTERLYQGTSGHPYLFPNWETGEMLWNDKLLKDVAFKFDIHLNQLMFMRFTDNDSIMLNTRLLDQFTFYSQDNRKFVKLSITKNLNSLK